MKILDKLRLMMKIFPRRTEDTSLILEKAREHARERGKQEVGTENILYAIADSDYSAVKALNGRNITPKRINSALNGIDVADGFEREY